MDRAASAAARAAMSHARYALSDDEDAPAPAPPVLASEPGKHADVDDDRPAIHQLTHAWLNERGSPELLPWPGDLVDTVMDQLQQQQAILDSLMSDTATSDEEHFRLNLVQLDADRCRWLLRSFLRTRLDKVGAAPHPRWKRMRPILCVNAQSRCACRTWSWGTPSGTHSCSPIISRPLCCSSFPRVCAAWTTPHPVPLCPTHPVACVRWLTHTSGRAIARYARLCIRQGGRRLAHVA